METDYKQADFLGAMVAVLAIVCLLAVGLAAASLLIDAEGTPGHVDQAGSANPQALPSPQAGNSSQINPKADQAPPASQMPDKTQQSPAARGQSPSSVTPPATNTSQDAGNSGKASP